MQLIIRIPQLVHVVHNLRLFIDILLRLNHRRGELDGP